MKSLKKSLSFLLALVMCLSLCAVPAFATTEEGVVADNDNASHAAVTAWKAWAKESINVGDYFEDAADLEKDLEAEGITLTTLRDYAYWSYMDSPEQALVLPEKYGDLDNQQFFIAEFPIFVTGEAKLSFSTTSSNAITGYIGECGTASYGDTWIPIIRQGALATAQVSISAASSTEMRHQCGSNKEIKIGFALAPSTQLDSDITVTITLNGTSRTHTFKAGSGGSQEQAEQNPVTAVTINGANIETTHVLHLDNQQMYLYADVTGGNGTETVTWTSSNENVITLTPNAGTRGATINIVGPGVTQITAAVGSITSANYQIKVLGAAFIDGTSYETLADALENAEDNSAITVDTDMKIGNVPVAAGSTITATNSTEATVTNNTATVTPKTLTISKDGEEDKTAKAYVVSSGSGNSAKSAVVTDVKFDDNNNVIRNTGDSVGDYVNVAQVLANAVAANATGVNAIDVSSISSMTLRLEKTDNPASVTLTGTESKTKTELESKLNDSNITVYDVKPIATVTTATTTGGTTTTQTYDYDASKEVTGEFKFKLHVSDNSTDVGKTANLTHYHEDSNGTWTATPITGVVDNNGDVKITLNQFSYITVDSVAAADFATIVANAEAGSIITLDADVVLTDSVDVDKELTIDLNGHSISYAPNSVSGEKFKGNTAHDYLIGVKYGGNLTIMNSDLKTPGLIDGSALCVAVKLTTKGELYNSSRAALTIGKEFATNNFTIKGYEYGISGNGSRHNADLTVYGGTILATATVDASSTDSSGIYFPQDGALTIKGGTIQGYKSGVELRSGTLNVTGGTFKATATPYSSNPNGNGTTAVGAALAIAQHTTNKRIVANITGGTYSGVKTISIANPQNNAFDNVAVSGSASLLTDSIMIPEGYEWVTEGGVSTLEKSFVSEAYDGNVAQANFVDTTFINVQDSLYLNVVLYVGGTEKTNGSVKFSFLGINKTVALSDFDVVTSATLDQRSAIALATNGYYCYRDGNYYIVRLKVLAYQISAEAAVQLLDGDGKAVKLYQNTGASCFLNETAPLANKLLTINANNQYTGSVKTFLTNYSGSEAAVVAALLAYGTEAEKVWEYDGTKKS